MDTGIHDAFFKKHTTFLPKLSHSSCQITNFFFGPRPLHFPIENINLVCMALRAKLLNAKQTEAGIDWAARIDTPERNELSLEFGVSYLMVPDSPRSPIPASVDGSSRHQVPVWFGEGGRLLGFSGKKVPDFTGKAKKAVVKQLMVDGKFGGQTIPGVNPGSPSYGVRYWAPENADEVLDLINKNKGNKLTTQLTSAMQTALKHSTKHYVLALQKELGLDLVSAAWIQNDISPEHLFSDVYVSSVGVDKSGKLHTIGRDDFYAATDVAKSAARKAFYSSINASLLRLGQLPLNIEPERSGVEGLASTLARTGMPSYWCGKGAGAIGLIFAEATLKDIKSAIIDGAWRGEKLRSDLVKKVAYSVVMATPKTPSMLLAASDPAVRDSVEAAFDKSWDKYIETMEMLLTSRRDKDGVRSVGLTGILGAYWKHRTSSTGDPHLHMHGVISSSALGLDGKWRTIDSEVFYSVKQIAEAAAMQALYEELSAALDLPPEAWTWKQVGSVLVPEITALLPAVSEFSGASRHMSDVIKDAARVGVIDSQTWREHDRAWKDHRVDKESLAERLEHELDESLIEGADRADKLRKYWRERAMRVVDPETGELTPVDIDSIKVRTDESASGTPELVEEDLLRMLTDMHSWKLTDVASLLITDLDGRERIERAAEIVNDLHSRGLIHTPEQILPDGTRQEMPPATPEMIRGLYKQIDTQNCETKAFKHVVGLKVPEMVTAQALQEESLIHAASLELSKSQRKPIFNIDTSKLDPDQKNAVAAIAQGNAITLITGVAGSGKTTIQRPVVRAAKAQGIHTVVISRNALRAQETFDSIEADSWVTAARIWQIKTDQPTMVFVDEGALLNTSDWLNILDLARRRNVQVVSIGDRYQNQPIDRRAGWASVIAGIEAGGTHVNRLEKSYRCRAWEVEATLLREADGKAIDKAKADQRIIPVTGNAAKEAARTWQERLATYGERCIVVTVTNGAAAEVSAEIQKLQHITAETPIARDSFCGVGDLVRTRLNVMTEDNRRIYNGDTWIVDSINSTDGKISLRHTTKATSGRELRVDDNGELVGEPLIVTVDEAYYKSYVELAYCTTTDTSQGAEGDRSITVVESDAMARSRINTASTRGKLAPIYIVPVDPGLLPPQVDGAAEEILKLILQRDDIAQTAHETVKRRVTTQSIAEQIAEMDRELADEIRRAQNPAQSQSPLEPTVPGPRPDIGGPFGP